MQNLIHRKKLESFQPVKRKFGTIHLMKNSLQWTWDIYYSGLLLYLAIKIYRFICHFYLKDKIGDRDITVDRLLIISALN